MRDKYHNKPWLLDEDKSIINLWDNLVTKIFAIDIPEHIDHIYIDLDSCLSILTSQPLPDENGVKNIIIKNTVMTIANFLEVYKNFAYIHIYYSFKPTKIFNEYIPGWNEERNKRLENSIVDLFHTEIIRRLKKISLSSISLIECFDATIIDIVKDIQGNRIDPYDTMIVSRDHHYQCLFSKFPKMTIYDGRHMITNKDIRTLEKYPGVHYTLVPYYYALTGLIRHDYKGIKGYGPNKAKKYIEDNLEKILNDEDELFKSLANEVNVMKVKI